MVAMRGCGFRGEAYLSSFPLFVPIWIVGSTAVRPTDYLEGRPTSPWLNN